MALEKIDIDTLDPAATIVVATGNAHKLTEIEVMLGKVMPEVRFVALGQLGDFEDPEENGTTFLENAIIKAQAAVEETGLMAIADDSGLVVDALDGEPGVYSARYAGVHGDDAAISQLILQTERLEVTRQVFELTPDKSLQRELLLLKVACNTAERAEMREIAAIYKSKIIDLSPDSMVFELTGRPEKINAFLKMFSGYDILELCRTGITALERGGKHPHMQKPPQEVRAAQLPLPGTHCPQDEE